MEEEEKGGVFLPPPDVQMLEQRYSWRSRILVTLKSVAFLITGTPP